MTIKPVRAVTAEEIEKFNRDGVVWLRGIIDPAEARAVGERIDDAINHERGFLLDLTAFGQFADNQDVAQRVRSDDFAAAAAEQQAEIGGHWDDPSYIGGAVLRDPGVEAAGSPGRFISFNDAWHDMPFVRQLGIESDIPAIAAQLMGSQTVRWYSDQILVKDPLTAERTAWHQDLAYEYIGGEHAIGLRVMADPEDAEVGTVEYWRGSHAGGTVYKCNYFISDRAAETDPGADLPPIEENKDQYDIVTFEPQPGDIVAHHLRTVHGAGGNLSKTRRRRAVTLRYTGDDSHFLFRPCAPPQGFGRLLEDGQPFSRAEDHFPRCWPKG